MENVQEKMSLKEQVESLNKQVGALKKGENNSDSDKGFKLPRKVRSVLKKSKKKLNNNKLLFFYFKKNGRLEGPTLVPYSDNVLVYNYKAYEVDPRAVWDWGKYKAYAYKEIDRRPISNLNLKEIKRRGDLTDSDEILIKAVMRAVSSGVKKQANLKVLIIIAVVVTLIAAFFMFKPA